LSIGKNLSISSELSTINGSSIAGTASYILKSRVGWLFSMSLAERTFGLKLKSRSGKEWMLIFANAHGAVGNRLAGFLGSSLSTIVYRRGTGSPFLIRETGDGGTSAASGGAADFTCSAKTEVSTARREIFS
jgi:hypothetical protein